ncbi:MAG: hypothetical protein H0T78_03570, partial [Longispora sp.]|nr:hypothetical protein [Longispora sp. (in: high G+C Gram-positive bacteria)]
MQPIIAPVNRDSDADTIGNLQEALRVFLDRDVFPEPSDKQRSWEKVWHAERATRRFGDATSTLVNAFQEAHNLLVDPEVDGLTADAMNGVLEALGAFAVAESVPHPEWLVRGHVVGAEGPRAEVQVKLYDRDLLFGRPFEPVHHKRDGDTGQLLGRAVTGSDGEFHIAFHASRAADATIMPPELVFAVGEGETPGALTVIRLPDGLHLFAEVEVSPDEAILGIRPRAVETVRVELGNSRVTRSEYERIWQSVNALLPSDGASDPEARVCEAARMLDEETYRDVTFLTRQAGLPRELIDRFVESCRLAERINDLDVKVPILYGISRAAGLTDLRALGSASQEEMDAAIVAAGAQGTIPVVEDARRVAATAAIQRLVPRLALELPFGYAGDTLGDVIGVAVNSTAQRITLLRLAAEHSGESLWQAVRDTSSLTEYADELRYVIDLAALTDGNVALIKGLRNTVPSVKTAHELAFRLDDDVLLGMVANPNVPIPAEVPGHDDSERRAHFGAGVLRLLRNAYPVAALARAAVRLGGEQDAPLSRSTVAFLTRVALERPDVDLSTVPLTAAADLAEGSEEEKAEILAQIVRVQRLYRISSGEENLIGLLRTGARSAYDIVRTTHENDFVTAYADQLGGLEQARLTYRRAENVTAAGLTLAVRGKQLSRDLPHAAGVATTTTSWTSMIDPAAGCGQCENCRTWQGSAAYLSELMLFLDRRGQGEPSLTPLEVLWQRRPDLARLRLSCAHTEEPLPYLDVVIETLESLLAPPVENSGGENVELANPDEVYDRLAAAVCPPVLPFDRSLETVRVALARLGADRVSLLETFAGGFGEAEEAKRRERDAEILALGDLDWRILTGVNLAGEESAVSTAELFGVWAEEEIPTGLTELTQRLGITAEELNTLLSCRFVNPLRVSNHPNDRAQVLAITAGDEHAGESGWVSRADGSTAAAIDLRRIALFVRMWRKLGWEMSTVDSALLVAGAVTAEGVTPNVLRILGDLHRLATTTGAEVSTLLAVWVLPNVEITASVLGIPAAELDLFRELAGMSAQSDPASITALGELIALVRGSGLNLDQLRYLYGVERPGPSALAPQTNDLSTVVEALRVGLAAAIAAFPDTPGVTSSDAAQLRDVRGGEAIVRVLADWLEVTPGLVRALLGEDPLLSAQLGTPTPMALLRTLDPGVTGTGARKPHDSVEYPPAIGALLGRLHKIVTLTHGMNLTIRELCYFIEHSGDFGGFTLPGGREGVDSQGLNAWRRVAEYITVRDELTPEENALIDVFTGDESDRVHILTRVTGWDPAVLTEAMATGGVTTEHLVDERSIHRIQTIIAVSRSTGIAATLLKKWAVETPDRAQVTSILAVLPDKSPSDQLRARRRDALIACALATPTLRAAGLRTTTDLYRYFLLDVEAKPCTNTTRVEQAITSIQLYVQRCLLGLEAPEVTPNAINIQQWATLKNRAEFEAAREAFLHPENLLLPELREDRSPIFRELEEQLASSDLTAGEIERVALTYLTKLQEVANLDICGYHWERERDIDVVHVFGRTRTGTPHRYFYRRLLDSVEWTPWEPVGLDIRGVDSGPESSEAGVHLLPVTWHGVLYLFWTQWMSGQRESNAGTGSGQHWDVSLAWSRYDQDAWSSPQTSDATIEVTSDVGVVDLPRRVRLQARVDGPMLRVEFLGAGGGTEMVFGDPTAEPRVVHPSTSDIPSLTVAYSGSRFQRQRHQGALELVSPTRKMPATRLLGADLDCTDVTLPSQYDLDPLNGMVFVQDSGRTYAVTLREDRASVWPRLHRILDPRPPLATLPGLMRHLDDNRAAPVNLDLPHTADFTTWVSPWRAAALELLPDAVADAASRAGLPTTRRLGYPVTIEERQAHAAMVYDGIPEPLRRVLATHAALPTVSGTPSVQARFATFFHPHASTFLRRVHRQGLAGLYTLDTQSLTAGEDAFTRDFQPVAERVSTNLPRDDVDFTPGGAYAVYNWELFVYLPLLIANYLSQHQRFAEAQEWFHRVFDPIDSVTDGNESQWAWRAQPLRHGVLAGYDLLLGDPTPVTVNDAKGRAALEHLYRSSRYPFQPHRLAQVLPGSYRTYVVMAYLDNLLAWGDHLLRNGTVPATAEATRLFALASNLLGSRPATSSSTQTPEKARSFAELRQQWIGGGAVLADWEDRIPFVAPPADTRAGNALPALLTLGRGSYFGLPRNGVLLRYWDKVDERLSRVRNCGETADGPRKTSPLTVPLDSRLLRRATTAGIDVHTIAEDLSAPMPGHRFPVMLAKAMEVCVQVRSYGAALLSALEHRDSETLTLMRSEHERVLLGAVTAVRTWQAAEVGTSITALREQRDSGDRAVEGIDRQIIAAEIRQRLLESDVAQHNARIEQAEKVERFLLSKYTNADLRGYLSRELGATYFRAYQLAHDLALQAERCYRFELGIAESGIIPVGYWDDLRTGLLAGEHLELALHQLERAYRDGDRREFEITRHVSLRQINPLRLVELRATGRCEFELPESLFDLDFPGHYFRRVKTVSISVPCVAGPFTAINGTLTLVGNRLRTVSDINGTYEETQTDPRFVRDHVPVQSIATSGALDDSGMFELDFHDSRYLPFEGAGALSRWRLVLADEFRQFDYDSISDVVMHLRYTARDGGSAFGQRAVESVTKRIGMDGAGLSCMFSVRHDFPDVWQRLLRSRGEDLTVDVPVDGGRFPYFAAHNDVTVTGLSVLMPGARLLRGEVLVEFLSRPSGRPFADSARLMAHARDRITVFDKEGRRVTVPVRVPGVGQESDTWRLTIPAESFGGEYPAGDVILLCT